MLQDAQLEKRLRSLVEQLAKGVGRSIPFACQDWAAAKAAYRFFSNGRGSEEQNLSGSVQAHCGPWGGDGNTREASLRTQLAATYWKSYRLFV
jgi:hypothetical protein